MDDEASTSGETNPKGIDSDCLTGKSRAMDDFLKSYGGSRRNFPAPTTASAKRYTRLSTASTKFHTCPTAFETKPSRLSSAAKV